MAFTFEELQGLKRGTNAREIFNFPFQEDMEIAIRVATQNEIIEAKIYGKDKAKEIGKGSDTVVAEDYGIHYLLSKAVTQTDGQDFFKTPEQVGELTVDERDELLDRYHHVQAMYAPHQQLKTPEEFENLVSEIKKNGALGNSLSSYTLRKLVRFMAQNYQKSQNDSGSISTPAKTEEPSLNETPSKSRQKVQIKNEIQENL